MNQRRYFWSNVLQGAVLGVAIAVILQPQLILRRHQFALFTRLADVAIGQDTSFRLNIRFRRSVPPRDSGDRPIPTNRRSIPALGDTQD